MDKKTLPEYIRFLLSGAVYPHPADLIRLTQTHISYIILVDNYVYKWKKPVDFGFLDFTSLEKRRHYCEEELRLNRRLCPDIYLDIVRVTSDEDGFALNGEGETVEYGVMMRRLPEQRMMVRVIERGGLTWEHIDKLTRTLVSFYERADCGECSLMYGSPEAIAGLVRDNFAETRKYVGTALRTERFEAIQGYAERFLDHRKLFQERIDSGHVRECHGDLHSGNICLTERIDIFDCIEFNKSLRYVDVAADIAFLAMDLDFHGLQQMSDDFIRRFVELSGDTGLLKLLDFYKCYRAYVRGKIGLLTWADAGVDQHARARSLQLAGRYFELAEKYGAKSER